MLSVVGFGKIEMSFVSFSLIFVVRILQASYLKQKTHPVEGPDQYKLS